MAAELKQILRRKRSACFRIDAGHVRLCRRKLYWGTALCHPDTGKPDDAMRNAWRLAVRSPIRRRAGLAADSGRSRTEIYGPWTRRAPIRTSRDFKALAGYAVVPSSRDSFARRICHGQHLGADRPGSANRRLYRSSLVLCRLPGTAKVSGATADQENSTDSTLPFRDERERKG